MAKRRPYSSQLREDQTRRTRGLILEALAEQLSDTGRNDFSMNEVAERAGVSVRTVYRHFPNRTDLIDGINEWIRASPQPIEPTSPEDLLPHYANLIDWFEDNASFVEASHLTTLGREVRKRGREARGARAKEWVDKWLDDFSESERREVLGIFASMFGSQTWRTMRQEVGLSVDETKNAVTRVIQLVMDDLQRRRAERREDG